MEEEMEATNILSSEHRVIENVLDSLDAGVVRLKAGEDFRPGFFIQAADFIKGFADGCHHMKEEGVLFKEMVERGVPVENGPIGAMLFEHEKGRGYTRQIRLAAEHLQSGDPSAKHDLIDAALGYTNLLRAHIYKEDNMLFPLADKVIPVADQAAVLEGFERVEHEETGEGVHEKYLALAQALALEVQGQPVTL